MSAEEPTTSSGTKDDEHRSIVVEPTVIIIYLVALSPLDPQGSDSQNKRHWTEGVLWTKPLFHLVEDLI